VVSTACTCSAYARMSASCRVNRCFSSSDNSRCARAATRSTSAMVREVDTAFDAISTFSTSSTSSSCYYGRMAVRQAAVAGTWYPDDPLQLTQEVDRYLARAEVAAIDGPVLAIVAPHAGLMYSGPVAAFAYKIAAASTCTAIVLVGPSHFVP